MTSIVKIIAKHSSNRIGSFLLPVEVFGTPEIFDLFQKFTPFAMKHLDDLNKIHVAATSPLFDEFVPVTDAEVPEYAVTFRGGRVDSVKRVPFPKCMFVVN